MLTTCYCTDKDYQKLQDDIHSISEWVSANHLHLNVSKCKTMLISRKRTCLEAPPLLINGRTLKQVECFKYLGLLLTSDLSWSPHIETACSKARKLLGMIIIASQTIQVLTPCYIYTKVWLDLILSMPPKFGTHTFRKTLNYRGGPKICSKGYYVVRTMITATRIYLIHFNCLNYPPGDFI